MASITRDDVATLIAEEYSAQVIQAAVQGSTVLAAFPNVPMGTKVTNMPVLASLPEAAWVGDVDNTARKPTAKVTWDNKRLVAEEIAVTVPIHENTVDDSVGDPLGTIATIGGQALGKKLDQSVLFGVEKPASWTSPDLLAASVASGSVVAHTLGPGGSSDIYGAGLQVAEMISDVGYDPTVAIAKRGLRFKFANLRDADGGLILQGENIIGFDTFWNRNGAWLPDAATELIADANTVVIGVRQDITVKYLDQATFGTGENQINLAEQDMVALRFKGRFAYVLGNPVTAESGGRRVYGVGAVVPPAAEEE